MPVSFASAVAKGLRQYAVFSGRARRSEYWWFLLFTVLVSLGTTVIDAVVFGTRPQVKGPTTVVVTLVLLLPILAVSVRRLHDVNRSGWFLLLGLIPLVGWIVLLVVMLRDSDGDNRHGPSPKDAVRGVAATSHP
jgi:uncharacterized membrane protein YhaH (DUF805 family)